MLFLLRQGWVLDYIDPDKRSVPWHGDELTGGYEIELSHPNSIEPEIEVEADISVSTPPNESFEFKMKIDEVVEPPSVPLDESDYS